MKVLQVGGTRCSTFDRYEKVPETVPLNFLEEDVTWVVSNLSGAAGTLGVKALELKNLLLRFRCAFKDLWVVVADLDDWMATPPPGGIPINDGLQACYSG